MIRRLARFVVTALATAALAVVAWLGWFGFHADSSELWQLIGLGVTIALVVLVAGVLGRSTPAVLGAVLGLGFIASYDWGTGPDADALWAIAVLVLLIGATMIGVLMGVVAAIIRKRRGSVSPA